MTPAIKSSIAVLSSPLQAVLSLETDANFLIGINPQFLPIGKHSSYFPHIM
jgi:hypothetical protein